MHGPLPLIILQACIIIAAARSIGALARWLGQPSVIAEVIAGILLGPSLLGRVAPTMMALMALVTTLMTTPLLKLVAPNALREESDPPPGNVDLPARLRQRRGVDD